MIAGVVTALVGFTSSFAVVRTGLRAVGASSEQAASGLFALCLVMSIGIAFLSLRYRMPITLAWSTPGAALLAGKAAPDGASPRPSAFHPGRGDGGGDRPMAAAGLVCTGDSGVRCQAMLAGIVLPLCLEPVRALADEPLAIAPAVVV